MKKIIEILLLLGLVNAVFAGSFTKYDWPAALTTPMQHIYIFDASFNPIGGNLNFTRVEKDLRISSASNFPEGPISEGDVFDTSNEDQFILKVSYRSETVTPAGDRDSIGFASDSEVANPDDHNGFEFRFWAPKLAYYKIETSGDTVAWNGDITQPTTGGRVHVLVALLEDERESSPGYNGTTSPEVDRTCAQWMDDVSADFNGASFNPYICRPNDLVPNLSGAAGVKLYAGPTGATPLEKLFFSDSNSYEDIYIGADPSDPREVVGGKIVFEGLENADGTNLISSEFPGDINFTFPPGARLDSAAIFDTDGDGLADSAVAWYDSPIKDGELTSVKHSWPLAGGYFDASVFSTIGNKSIVSITGDFKDDLSLSLRSGNYKSTLEPDAGGVIEESTPFIDKIGPVITGATIVPGSASASEDTLKVRFSKDIDEEALGKDGLYFVNSVGKPVHAKAVKNEDGIWTFVVTKGEFKAGEELKLNFNTAEDILKATDGNVPHRDNKPETITSAGNLPPFVNEGSGVYDNSGDGKVDSVTFEFEKPLTDDQKQDMKMYFHWKDENDSLLVIEIDIDDLVKIPATSDQGERYAWIVPSDAGVQTNLTSINSRDYGYVTASQTVKIVGEEKVEQSVGELDDYMPPVIDSAWISPELNKDSKGDKLTIIFSEPIDIENIKNTEFLNFKSGSDDLGSFNKESLKWDEDAMTLTLTLAADKDLSKRPNAADSLVAVGIMDAHGNEVTENTKYTMLSGNPRILINSSDIVGIDRKTLADMADQIDPIEVIVVDRDVSADDLKAQGALGFLLDFAASPLKDENGEIDVDKIKMVYKAYYFTPNGEFVASLEGDVKCNDDAFNGNCFENRKRVFIRWNMLSQEGRVVGVGAYISRLYIFVKGSKKSYKHTEFRTFGVHSSDIPYKKNLK